MRFILVLALTCAVAACSTRLEDDEAADAGAASGDGGGGSIARDAGSSTDPNDDDAGLEPRDGSVTSRDAGSGNDAGNSGDGGGGTLADAGPAQFTSYSSTYFGGTADDAIVASEFDSQGNLVVAGRTASADLPVRNPGNGAYAQQAYGGGTFDAYVARFDKDGALIWSTWFGGSGKDLATDVGVDAQGNVYVSGNTSSKDLPVLDPGGGAYFQGTPPSGSYEITFVAKFDAAGVLKWATYFGGTGWNDLSTGMAVGPAGDVFVVGRAGTSDFPIQPATGAYNQNKVGLKNHAYIAHFEPSGRLRWSTLYGGDGDDNEATDVALDGAGNLLLTGWTNSPKFPVQDPGGGAFHQATLTGSSDAFLVAFDSTGARKWATYYGGTGSDIGYAVATDPAGNVFLGCECYAGSPTLDPGNGAYFQAAAVKFGDAYLARFDAAGRQTWATFFGGDSADEVRALATDASGRLYMSGSVNGAGFKVLDPGGVFHQATPGGFRDGFLAQFSSTGALEMSTYLGGTANDFGWRFAVSPGGTVVATGEASQGFPVKEAGGTAYHQATRSGTGADGYLLRLAR